MKSADSDPTPGPSRLLKLREAGGQTSLSVATLRRAIRLKQLAAYRIGRRAVRVSEADLQAWPGKCRHGRG